ncbi:MAG: oxidoreductase, partial [Pseudomonadota bacterium]
SADRGLGEAFEGLAGLYGSGLLTRYWNGHPDCAGFSPKFGDTLIVVGNGNVSMDVVRLLAKGAGDFEGSDFDPAHVTAGIRQIHIVGRSPAERAKFDSVMVRELGKIPGLAIDVDARSTVPEVEGDKRLAALMDITAQEKPEAETTLTFHFDWHVDQPVKEAGRLTGMRFKRGAETLTLPCTSAVTAIGYDDEGTLDRAELFGGAAIHETGRIAPGLYATGWFKRGPTGTIPENRADAQAVASLIAEDAGPSGKPGRAALQDALGDQIITYEDWQAVDAAECQAAPPGRCRQKITSRDAMLAVIAERRAP